MQEQINVLEKKLVELFKEAPKLPEGAVKWLVKYFPWLALVFGILQAIAALSLFSLGRRTNDVIDIYNEFARSYGVANTTPELNIFYWIAVAFVAASAVMLLLAYPGLKEHKKAGWNWLFYGVLLNVVYGVFSIFFDSYYGGGFSRFIGALIGTVISLWILFQVRPSYVQTKKSETKDEKK